MTGFLRQAAEVLEAIKFRHSVFALPFALTGALLGIRGAGLGAAEIGGKLGWIVVAMVAARSAAMGFNRLIDASIDARNPRTAARALPSGRLSGRFVAGFVALASAALVLAASQLNPLCFRLSPLALAAALGYSYTKRFTALSHLALGSVLGIAPAAAWIAVHGSLDPRILLLSAAVALWTAGFDIIYSCQDTEFDRASGLRSIPARLGIARALQVSRALHVGMVALLALAWSSLDMGSAALAGLAAIAVLLAYEHSLVKSDDLSRVDAAFFAANGWVSVLFLASWAADLWLAVRWN